MIKVMMIRGTHATENPSSD